jgi:hypothetical protein
MYRVTTKNQDADLCGPCPKMDVYKTIKEIHAAFASSGKVNYNGGLDQNPTPFSLVRVLLAA